jgi:hypothetical protein
MNIKGRTKRQRNKEWVTENDFSTTIEVSKAGVLIVRDTVTPVSLHDPHISRSWKF